MAKLIEKGEWIANKKAFPLHRDDFYLSSDLERARRELQQGIENAGAHAQIALTSRDLIMRNHPLVQIPVRASYNQPQAWFHLLSALIGVPHHSYIRAIYLMQHLNAISPQFYWSTTIVGHMLAGIAGVCQDIYLVEQKYVNDARALPFAQGRDAKGYYYVLDPQNGNEGILWLMAMRANVFELCNRAATNHAFGRLDSYVTKEQGASAALTEMEVVPDPVRSKENFQGSLKPGVFFDGTPVDPA